MEALFSIQSIIIMWPTSSVKSTSSTNSFSPNNHSIAFTISQTSTFLPPPPTLPLSLTLRKLCKALWSFLHHLIPKFPFLFQYSSPKIHITLALYMQIAESKSRCHQHLVLLAAVSSAGCVTMNCCITWYSVVSIHIYSGSSSKKNYSAHAEMLCWDSLQLCVLYHRMKNISWYPSGFQMMHTWYLWHPVLSSLS